MVRPAAIRSLPGDLAARRAQPGFLHPVSRRRTGIERATGVYLRARSCRARAAGLVQVLGEQLEAAQLDPDIAYLTAGHFQPTPFARAWRVEAWFPFSLKRLRSELRARGVGRITVKKRGSPLEPERLIRELRLGGEQERTVFLTHLRGRPLAILCLPDKLILKL